MKPLPAVASVALSRKESARVSELESVIQRGLSTFIDVGRALHEIREGRLYRQSHETFEAYCRERWGWTRQRANQLIAASSTAENLETVVSTVMTEGTIRPLASLPPEEQREVWKEAVETAPNGRPTAEQVKRIVTERHAPAATPVRPFDEAAELNRLAEFLNPLFERWPWERRDRLAKQLDWYANVVRTLREPERKRA